MYSKGNIVVKRPKISFEQVVAGYNTYKFKMPCKFDNNGKEIKRKMIEEERSEILNCNVGELNFIVTSKKSKSDLNEEFEKEKEENKVEIKQINGFKTIDFITSKYSTTSVQETSGSKQEFFEVSRERIYFVNSNWLVKLQVNCGFSEKDHCESQITDENTLNLNTFFDSLEIIE